MPTKGTILATGGLVSGVLGTVGGVMFEAPLALGAAATIMLVANLLALMAPDAK